VFLPDHVAEDPDATAVEGAQRGCEREAAVADRLEELGEAQFGDSGGERRGRRNGTDRARGGASRRYRV
jgi:hypothetical protein